MTHLTKAQLLSQDWDTYERESRVAARYPSIAASVDESMANHDAVSGRGCKALPLLLDDPEDSVADCDGAPDGSGPCDRHRYEQEIGSRLRRMRARGAQKGGRK